MGDSTLWISPSNVRAFTGSSPALSAVSFGDISLLEGPFFPADSDICEIKEVRSELFVSVFPVIESAGWRNRILVVHIDRNVWAVSVIQESKNSCDILLHHHLATVLHRGVYPVVCGYELPRAELKVTYLAQPHHSYKLHKYDENVPFH